MELNPDTLKAQKERLELVLEGTRLGMWDWNPQTNEVVFDERWAQMLGHTLDEIEFNLESWSSRVHPDDLADCYADIQAHIDGEVDFYENVHRMRHADGRWVHILDRGRIVERDAEGRPTRFTGTHTDISAQREAEMRARSLARARTLFLATMSHEIRTPLHGMLGIAELMATTGLDDAQKHLLEIISKCGESLLVLVNDILDFSSADEGRLKIANQVFSVTEVLDGVVQLYSARASQKGLLFTATRAPGLGHAWGDEHRLRQILSNLVNNAIKFTKQGSVTLAAHREGDDVHFQVSDTGVGIENPERVFFAFEQEDASNTGRREGTGLGLAIVRLLTKAMGGEVGVESTRGQGSHFRVRLPMPSAAPPSPKRPDTIQELPAMRILVADDNPVNQMVIRGMLQNAGHSCTTVDTGSQALSAGLASTWDCIFLDLHMPEMSGDDVAQKLRAAGVSTRIIVASADTLTETRERCQAKGVDSFLAKPFTRASLFAQLEQANHRRV